MARWMIRTGLVGVAVAGLGLASPTTALAAPVRTTASKVLTDADQAGYAVTAPATAAESVEFTVPKITCTAATAGFGTGALIFTKKKASESYTGGLLYAVCEAGIARYSASVIVDGSGSYAEWAPKPGNSITVTVTSTLAAASATIEDNSLAKSTTLTGKGATNFADFEGIDALDSGSTGDLLPVAPFGTVALSNASIDGGTPATTKAKAYNMVAKSTVLISTSGLGTGGNNWTQTFENSK
jgi:hypothetical protein